MANNADAAGQLTTMARGIIMTDGARYACGG